MIKDECKHNNVKWESWSGNGISNEMEFYQRRSGYCPDCNSELEQAETRVTQVYRK